jgi:hypothetical protein
MDMISTITIVAESAFEPMISSTYAFYEDDIDALINIIYYIAKVIRNSELKKFLIKRFDNEKISYRITFLYNYDEEKLIVSAFENDEVISDDYIVVHYVEFNSIKAIISFLELYVYDEDFISGLDTSKLA